MNSAMILILLSCVVDKAHEMIGGAAAEPSIQDTAQDTSQSEDTGLADSDSEPDTPENLLQNPSFEDGDLHWNVWGGAEIVEDNAHDGRWALKADNGNGAEQIITGLEPNTMYSVSGFGKIEPGEGISIGVKDYGGSQQTVTFDSEVYEAKSFTFSTGLSNTTAVVFAYKHSGDNLGFTDNLSVTKVGEGPLVLMWSDEFDGVGSPDESKWGFEEGFVRNNELQWYQQDNVYQDNGVLVIEGREEQRPNPNYIEGSTDWRTSREFIEYTSASINTRGKFEWQYGQMVVRAKVTNESGTWPAIWTLGTSCDWPSNGEVDVMENYGGKILANFAWGTNQPWSPNWDTVQLPVDDFEDDWIDDFHLWELSWNSDRMAILIDGVEVNSVDLNTTVNGNAACAGQNPFQQSHYVLLNLALGGNAGGSVDDLVFPTQYLIDYIRIYQ